MGFVRHALQLGAGFLVAKGYIDGGVAEAVVGALVSIGTAVWFWKTGVKPSVEPPAQ